MDQMNEEEYKEYLHKLKGIAQKLKGATHLIASATSDLDHMFDAVTIHKEDTNGDNNRSN